GQFLRGFMNSERDRAIADICCEKINGSPKGVFEVETLYAEDSGSGKPRDKLRETFTKYEEIESVKEINIILDNLSTMLHLRTIAELKQIYRDWEEKHGKEVNFYTIDLERQEIVPIESIAQDAQDLKENL
ncbi:MAG: hypothetical protein ABEI86_11000, partial [Halobacteriaceae archaeon]